MKAMIKSRAAMRGFTMIELLVTISIAAILLAVAIPSFRSFVLTNRVATQANDMITALNLARSEAVKRSANVTVCKSTDGTTCVTSGNWAQGWIVLDAASNVIRVQQALGGGNTLSGGTNVVDTVTFTSSGRTSIPTAATVASTTLTLCPPSPATVPGRAIQLERTGRTRVGAVACP